MRTSTAATQLASPFRSVRLRSTNRAWADYQLSFGNTRAAGHQCNGGDCPTASGSVAPLVRDLPKGQVLDGFPVNGLMCSVYSNVVTFGVPSTAAGSSCGWIGFKMDCVHGSTRLTASGVSRCVGNLDIPDGYPKRAWRSVQPRSADAPQPPRLMPIKSEQKNRVGIVTAWQ